ncbi:MAG: ABC transporter permease [Isosphaerales bacterium]
MSDRSRGISARLRRVAGLVRKESLEIIRDPSSYLIAGVLPLLLLFLFAYAVSLDLRKVPVALVVEQATPESDSLVASFRNSRYFDVRLARHRKEVEDELVFGRVRGVIVLASDFADRLGRGEQAPVQVIVDGSDPNTAALVQGYVQGVWANWLGQEAASKAGLAVRPGAEAPIEIVAGNTIPALLIGLAEGTVMLSVGVFAFRIPFQGSIPLLYASMVVYLVAVIGVGLFISSLARTQQQAYLGTFVFMVPAVLLSGFASPIENMPDWLQTATLLNPLWYDVTIVKGLFLKGMPVAMVVRLLWPLALIALTSLTAATLLFRHRVE